MEPLSVAVRRGKIVESVHRVHAVAVQNGSVVAAAGDHHVLASLRSSAKPIQALLLARAREDLDENDLAIASASHFGTEIHIDAVHTPGPAPVPVEFRAGTITPPSAPFGSVSGFEYVIAPLPA